MPTTNGFDVGGPILRIEVIAATAARRAAEQFASAAYLSTVALMRA